MVPAGGDLAVPRARRARRTAAPASTAATDDDVRALTDALHDALARLHAVLGDVAYNVVVHTAPRDDPRPFHWWVDIVPRLGVTGGFELGTGVLVNPVAPETAAATLRDAVRLARRRSRSTRRPPTCGASIEPIERHVDWMADAESITFTSTTQRGVGTRFDCLTRVGPFRTTDRMTVTEWEPGRAMGIEHRGVVTGRGRFTLAPPAARPHPLHLDRGAHVPVVDGRRGRRARGQARAARGLAPQPAPPEATRRERRRLVLGYELRPSITGRRCAPSGPPLCAWPAVSPDLSVGRRLSRLGGVGFVSTR